MPGGIVLSTSMLWVPFLALNNWKGLGVASCKGRRPLAEQSATAAENLVALHFYLTPEKEQQDPSFEKFHDEEAVFDRYKMEHSILLGLSHTLWPGGHRPCPWKRWISFIDEAQSPLAPVRKASCVKIQSTSPMLPTDNVSTAMVPVATPAIRQFSAKKISKEGYFGPKQKVGPKYHSPNSPPKTACFVGQWWWAKTFSWVWVHCIFVLSPPISVKSCFSEC